MSQDKRKSGISSYYGKASADWSPQADGDPFNNGHSAGYNSATFLAGGRQEPVKGGRDEEEGGYQQEEAWDIYADFNNAGPRYNSTPFATNLNAFGPNSGYRQIPTPDAKTDEQGGQVEMVTVPTLGPEWKASELRDMTKAGKREKKNDEMRSNWKRWNRGEHGFCGGWLTRKTLVFIIFGFAAVVGIALGFTIPRVPGLAFNSYTPLLAANGTFNSSIPTEFSRTPANFSFPAYASLQIDTTANYLPLTITHMWATVYDSETDYQVATADLWHQTFKAKTYSGLNLPLNFSYVAVNTSDTTWTNWYDACRSTSQVTGGNRPGVNFRLEIFMKIAGLIGTKGATTQVSDAACPFELPTDSA